MSLLRTVRGNSVETSCGVILVNLDSILLLQYPQGHWDLPKGHVESRDSDNSATVRRELAEETGISEISFDEEFIERTTYTYRHKGRKREKEVFWFSLTRIRSMLHFPMNIGTTFGWIGNKLSLS